MRSKGSPQRDVTRRVKDALAGQPGQSVKELAQQFKINRQYMAGFLAALEERGQVAHRKVGPARIYFIVAVSQETTDKVAQS